MSRPCIVQTFRLGDERKTHGCPVSLASGLTVKDITGLLFLHLASKSFKIEFRGPSVRPSVPHLLNALEVVALRWLKFVSYLGQGVGYWYQKHPTLDCVRFLLILYLYIYSIYIYYNGMRLYIKQRVYFLSPCWLPIFLVLATRSISWILTVGSFALNLWQNHQQLQPFQPFQTEIKHIKLIKQPMFLTKAFSSWMFLAALSAIALIAILSNFSSLWFLKTKTIRLQHVGTVAPGLSNLGLVKYIRISNYNT